MRTFLPCLCCSEYATNNITTNLYVISQPWLYSLAWCRGVHSVTTDAPQLLRNMSSPLFLMVTAAHRHHTPLSVEAGRRPGCVVTLHRCVKPFYSPVRVNHM